MQNEQQGPEDQFAKREKRAGIIRDKMARFFQSLSGSVQRKMRLAERRASGQREDWFFMMKRIDAREKR